MAASTVTYLTTPIVEVRFDPPPRGSGMTRDGYTKLSGAPTQRMIRLQGENRWRRLMAWQFSNLGTLFVRINGEPHVVREEDLPREGGQAAHATKRKYSQNASDKIGRTMHEWKRGKLRSGSGGKVKSREQAIAIGISQARRAGYKVPPTSHATKKSLYPYIGYWVHTRRAGGRDSEPVYVLGTCRRADEGIVGHDLRVRPLRLGKGTYTAVVAPDDVDDKP